MSKRVAILTGGGDVPGMNMCLKSLVYRLIDLGYETIGVRKGWEGLARYNPHNPSTYSEQFIELTKNLVRPIDRTSGSFLHSSRMDPRHTPDAIVPDFLKKPGQSEPDLTDHILHVIERLDYTGIIVIGDDDALQYAAYLSSKGVPIIGIPKTIHNNIFGTDYSLGFSTAMARGVAFIHELRALAGSREQIIVVESFAAKSGYSTLLMAMLAGVDRVLIPEVPYDPDQLAQLVMQDKRETPANYAVVLICDGTRLQPEYENKYAELLTANGNTRLMSSGMVAAHVLTESTREHVFLQHLTYLLRTGAPDGQDLLGATNFAFWAAHLLNEGKFGRMTAFVKELMWTDVDLGLAIRGSRQVDVASMYDPEQYKPNLSLIWSLESV
jgi:ATP-dependent phosphofructokinase / diphosphate-dependent phosphofructokinase